MISWDTCKQDFQWDGSLRDIYITPASLADWQAIFPLLRVQPEVGFLRESGQSRIPDNIDASFFEDSLSMLRFRIAGIHIVFHFFTPDEIECDLDPREVTGQAGLDALLAFIRQLGDLTHKRVALTPENMPKSPIISYDPARRDFQYHQVVA